jgi:non-ribosomal peptide synthetase component F
MAIIRAGASLVILDPTMEPQKLKHCIETADPTCIITNMSNTKWMGATMMFPSLKNISKVLFLESPLSENGSGNGAVDMSVKLDDPSTPPVVQADGAQQLVMTL